jgi:hypothetical protein
LALFKRAPDAYLTKCQASRKAADEAVLMDTELMTRYRRNMRTYLAQWAECRSAGALDAPDE